MPVTRTANQLSCVYCFWKQYLCPSHRTSNGIFARYLGTSRVLPQESRPIQNNIDDETSSKNESAERSSDEEGAMSRRLSEMTKQSLEQGGRSARKAIDEAGFSEELRRTLEAKVQDANFRHENPAAFAQINTPVSSFHDWKLLSLDFFSQVQERAPENKPQRSPGQE